MNKYPTAHLKCVMDPKWELLQVIHRLLMDKMKERRELEWVRSHQDDEPNKDITKLSDAAQLNIEVNALATQGLDKLGLNPWVPMDPSAEVLLHQQGRTINRDYKVSMQSNIQLLVLEQYYYQKRFGWTNLEYGKIDWSIFTPVYRREQNKRLKWANKFCMWKLPVSQRLHARESNMTNAAVHAGLIVKQMITYYNVHKESVRYQNEIYQVIKRLGKEMDLVLLDILYIIIRWSDKIPHRNKTNKIYCEQQQQATDRLLESHPSSNRSTKENNGGRQRA